jgi:pimeloyl-ACP methyl ester carboxylesterase/DNA-binding CsgD family transcriptional regulator
VSVRRQTIRFCRRLDGTRIAYASHGGGPSLVRTATWLTHLEFDWESPVWRHWLEGLAERHTVVGYDERGCGVSDRDVEDLSLEARLADLAAVIDAAGLERAALLGISHGGPLAVAYAALHPERVSDLVLYGTHARGRLMRDPSATEHEQAELMFSLIRMSWGRDDPVFRRLFTTLVIPGATDEQMRWFDDLQRVTTHPEMAVRLRRARYYDEVTREAMLVSGRALVMHARRDAVVPIAEGRRLATLIPAARFVPLDGQNHILLADEPAWPAFLAELHAFLGAEEPEAPGELAGDLSSREVEVVGLVAAGLPNAQIASRLCISERTVERHLTNVYVKLGVSGKAARAAAAAHFARAHESSASRQG